MPIPRKEPRKPGEDPSPKVSFDVDGLRTLEQAEINHLSSQVRELEQKLRRHAEFEDWCKKREAP